MNQATDIAIRDQMTKPGDDTAATVSIIILNYNGKAYLGDLFSSLAELNYPVQKIEIVIVDNASKDGSVDWIQQNYPNVRLLTNSANLGFAKGINGGARAASGDYLAFLNPDMRVDKQWLSALMETMLSEKDIACVGSVVLDWTGKKIDFAGRSNDALNLCPEPAADAAPLLDRSTDVPILFASGGAMLIRCDVFENLGGFDEDYFLYNEDVDLGWRLWLQGYKVLCSTRSLVYHRGGASSRKLAPEILMCLAQKYALYTLLKDMGDDQLWAILPGAVWFLVARARWLVSARASLGQTLRELEQEVETIWQKRMLVQSKRVRSDSEIYSHCGHPLGFLLSNPEYVLFKQSLEENSQGQIIPSDAHALAQTLTYYAYWAYKFNFDRMLEQPWLPHGPVESVEGLARRYLPPSWRVRIAPLWRRVRGRLTVQGGREDSNG